jgi:hypothetical protein
MASPRNGVHLRPRWRRGLAVSIVPTLILIPSLYVMVETRFPRRVEDSSPALAPQGETA